MSSSQEKAEVILIVIKRILKWLLIASITITILVGVIASYIDYKNTQEYTKKREEEDKVIIFADYHKSDCQTGYPYYYIIENLSDKIVTKVTFTVEVKKKGFSSALNSYTSIDEDKILNPKERYTRCFRAQKKDYDGEVKEKDVEIVVTYKDVTFSN
jgi:hypothetical protein